MTSLDRPVVTAAPGDLRLLVSLIASSFVVALVSTVGVPLAPAAIEIYGVGLEASQWILTITLLVAVVATPALGRLGDGPRRRSVLTGTLAVVCAGSVVAATASSFPVLLAGRALQGVGYGIVPIAMALAREHLSAPRRAGGLSALAITGPAGVGLGWSITGFLGAELGFHAPFWFAALFAALACLAVALTVPGDGGSRPLGRFDARGAALLGLGLGALLVAISNAASWGWTSGRVLGLVAAGLLASALWVAVELTDDHPLIDLRTSLSREVVAANLVSLCVGMSLMMGMTLITRLAQAPASTGYGFGADLFGAGLLLLPMSLGTIASHSLVGRLPPGIGVRDVLALGPAALATALLVLVVAHASPAPVLLATVILGLGAGAAFAAMPAVILSGTGPDRTGSAMSFNQVLRNVGGSIGSASSTTILAFSQHAGGGAPSNSGYTLAFATGAGAAAGVAVLVGRLRLPSQPAAAEPDPFDAAWQRGTPPP